MKQSAQTAHSLSVLSALITAFFWGLSYVATKYLLDTFSPVQIAALRFVVASISMTAIAAAFGQIRRIDKGDWIRAASAGLIGIPVYFLFENTGLNFTSAINGSLIIATIPVVNLLISMTLFREKVSSIGKFGVILSVVGVYYIVRSSSSGAGQQSSMFGNLLMIGAVVSWVIYTQINAPLVKKYNLLQLNMIQIWVGTIILIPLALTQKISMSMFTLPSLASLIYLGICCSALAYVFYLIALRDLGSITVTCFLNLVPVFGVIGSAVILHEHITLAQILGGILILAGVTMVTFRKAETKTEDLKLSRNAQTY